jgi:hypothetical protein
MQRRPIDRPAVNIPPRRRGRFDLDNEENENSLPEWEGRTPLDTYDLERGEDDGRRLLLDADFGDDSSDDGDFEPAEDEDEDEDEDDGYSSEQEAATEGDQRMQVDEDSDQDGERTRLDAESSSRRKTKDASHGASFRKFYSIVPKLAYYCVQKTARIANHP